MSLVLAYRGSGICAIEERVAPRAAPGELVVRLRTCGLCGTDLFKLAEDTVPRGTVLGHEVVGEVVEANAARDARGIPFVPGERVVVAHHVPCGECAYCEGGSETMCEVFRENLLDPGGFAEVIRVRERAALHATWRVPPTLPDEAAAFIEPGACVLRGVERAGEALAGRRPLAVVVGGGSMGLLHLLLLRLVRPDARILVVDPLASRRRHAEALGADATIEPGAAVPAEVCRLAPAGADVVFDTVGGWRVLRPSLEWTRLGGVIVLFAHAPPREEGTAGFDLNAFFKGDRRVVASYSGGPSEQSVVHGLVVSGRLDPSALVTRRVTFDRFADAVRALRAHEEIKVLVDPPAGGVPGSSSEPVP